MRAVPSRVDEMTKQNLDQNATEAGHPSRLLSLDAYRGLVMLLLAFSAAHWNWMVPIEKAHEDSPWTIGLLEQFEHVDWQGLVLWDMVQPSFMFMVGMSMAYSYLSRERQGQSYTRMLGHAIYRAIVLILLGVFLRSLDKNSIYWTFEDVITQIGLGYVFLFLLWKRAWQVQLACAFGLLFLYWCLFAFWPLPDDSFQYGAAFSSKYYTGFFEHWNKNTHPAHLFDVWFLNFFPREQDFVAHEEGYNTLNFIPSLATMIFGLMAGELLRKKLEPREKLKLLVVGGLLLATLGCVLQLAGICPIVKKIWTPSFGLLSTGLCLIVLAFLYAVIDILKWQRWAQPAVIVGRNSIAMYCMIYMTSIWWLNTLHRHLGTAPFRVLGDSHQLLLENLSVGLCLLLIAYWMNRRGLFLRI